MWRSLGCQVHVPYPLSVSRPFGQAIRSYSSSLSSSPFRSPNDRQINPPQPIYAFPPVALRVGRKKARVVPHDAAEVRGLYRSLIRAVQRFWDVRTREFLLDRIKKGFRDYAYWTWGPRVTSKLRDARKSLRIIQGANDGDRKHTQRLLELAYGRCGRLRHVYLKPYMKTPKDLPTSTTPHPHLVPMSAELYALMAHYSKRLITPIPQRRKLTQDQLCKLQKKHHARNLIRIQAPLPPDILREVEGKAMARKDKHDQKTVSVKEARRRRRYFQRLLLSVPILAPSPKGNGLLVTFSRYAQSLPQMDPPVLPIPSLESEAISDQVRWDQYWARKRVFL